MHGAFSDQHSKWQKFRDRQLALHLDFSPDMSFVYCANVLSGAVYEASVKSSRIIEFSRPNALVGAASFA